jgi:two-component sensor histidine kinase
MIVHELATNAAKYGALSTPQGRIEIAWKVEAGSAGQVLRLSWRETDGPAVAAPQRRGFGSRLIEQTVRGQLNGSVIMAFEPSGLVCDFEMPLEAEANVTAQAAE